MNVFLTFDVEIWCNGWSRLDDAFPASFERYVYGRSKHGDYALPKTLEILSANRLKGVFFVEPLFSARFGAQYLDRIVRLIQSAGQEVQLHLHPEWTDEITPALLANVAVKRQHLVHYDLEEQVQLIGSAKALLETASSTPVSAFRAGSYAADRRTFEALRRNGIGIDSSLNRCFEVSGRDLREAHDFSAPFELNSVLTYPVSTIRDGLGRLRPAQVGACSFEELRDAMWSARARHWSDFTIVSHNFEMLRPGSSLPDRIVANRFEKLCAHLAAHRSELPVTGFATMAPGATGATVGQARAEWPLPRATLRASVNRYAQQALRRLP